MFESGITRRMQTNPFGRPEWHEDAALAYRTLVRSLARRFIYRTDKLDDIDITNAIAPKIKTASLQEFEAKDRQLESLLPLLKGIKAQEKADQIFGGAWQAALHRQNSRRPAIPKPPERLSREEVAAEFAGFDFRDRMLESEKMVLLYYQELLAIPEFSSLRVDKKADDIEEREKIEITRGDVEGLVNDLKTRQAERITDPEERKKALAKLDDELMDLISELPPGQGGKRFELEVIYLIRRLIHASDEGHLVSVYHASPRIDLRPDMGGYDIELDVAGQPFLIQLKTFRRAASVEAREIQLASLHRAAEKAADSDTLLMTLDKELVERAFGSSVANDNAQDIVRLNKLEALGPVLETLKEAFGAGVLKLFSLSEQDIAGEAEALAQREREIGRIRGSWKQREIEDDMRIAEAEAAREKERQEELAKAEAIKERERQAAIDAQAEREALAKAKQERLEAKQREREAEKLVLEGREAEKKRLAAEASEKARKAEERRKKKEEKKLESGGWPPENLVGLFTSDMLKAYGFLPADWKDDAMQFMAAKKKLLIRFAKTKKGSSPSDRDAPGREFRQAFPSKSSLTNPSPEDIARVSRLVG